jgi:hypothetical protein
MNDNQAKGLDVGKGRMVKSLVDTGESLARKVLGSGGRTVLATVSSNNGWRAPKEKKIPC